MNIYIWMCGHTWGLIKRDLQFWTICYVIIMLNSFVKKKWVLVNTSIQVIHSWRGKHWSRATSAINHFNGHRVLIAIMPYTLETSFPHNHKYLYKIGGAHIRKGKRERITARHSMLPTLSRMKPPVVKSFIADGTYGFSLALDTSSDCFSPLLVAISPVSLCTRESWVMAVSCSAEPSITSSNVCQSLCTIIRGGIRASV